MAKSLPDLGIDLPDDILEEAMRGVSPQTDDGFDQWYSDVSKKTGLNANPDDPQHYYDYRSAFRDGVRGPGPDGHWPSKYKLEGHPRMIVDGVNTKTGEHSGLSKLKDDIGIDIPDDILAEAARQLDPSLVPEPVIQTGEILERPEIRSRLDPVTRSLSRISKLSMAMLEAPFQPKKIERINKDVLSGFVGSAGAQVASIPAAEAFFDIDTPVGRGAKVVADKLAEVSARLAPNDPNFVDKVASGVGSMSLFLIPGLGTKKVVSAIPRLGTFAARLAPYIGTGVSTVLESAAEAGSVFQDAENNPKFDRKGAGDAAFQSFWQNAIVVGLTNHFGLFADAGTAVAQAIKSASLEGIQEGAQEIISSIAKREPVDWGSVAESVGVGAVVGGGAKTGMNLLTRVDGNVVGGPEGAKQLQAEMPLLADAILGQEFAVPTSAVTEGIQKAIAARDETLKAGGDQGDAQLAGMEAFQAHIAIVQEQLPSMPKTPGVLATEDALNLIEPMTAMVPAKTTETASQGGIVTPKDLARSLGIEPYELSFDRFQQIYGEGRPEDDVRGDYETQVFEAARSGREVPESVLKEVPQVQQRLRQETARDAAKQVLEANELQDDVLVNLVDAIERDDTAFEAGRGRQFREGQEEIVGRTVTFEAAGRVQAVIDLARNTTVKTGRHEAFHAVTNLLMDTKDQAIITKKYGDMEKAADAFGEYRDGKSTGDKIMDRLFAQIKEWLEKFSNLFEESRFRSAQDIFQEIERGTIKKGRAARPAVKQYSAESFDEIATSISGRQVTARRDIPDSPLSKMDDSAKKGERGLVVDVDHANQVVFVEFGNKGAIAVSLEDLSETYQAQRSAREQYSAVPTGKNLVTIHNLSPENLRHAEKMGGLAVPSMAIARVEHPPTGFGKISLIADKDLIDPAASSQNRVFNADIYSPRYPSINYAPDYSEMKNLEPRLEKAKKYFTGNNSVVPSYASWHWSGIGDGEIENRGREALERDKKLKAIFGMEHGIRPDADIMFTKFFDEHNDAYQAFIDEVAGRIIKKERIFRGFTDAGNRRYKPHTLENVLLELKRELQGGEGFNYGLGSLRSTVAKRYRTLKQIQQDREKIVSDEQFEKEKEIVQDEFDEILQEASNKYIHKAEFGTLDRFVEALMEGVRRGNIASELEQWGFPNMDIPRISVFLSTIREMPTEYFEAKVQRIVRLQEFSGAVIPSNSPQFVRDILNKNGISYAEYTGDRERQAVLQKFSAELDAGTGKILYSVEDKGDDTDMVSQPGRDDLEFDPAVLEKMTQQQPMSRGAEGIRAPKGAVRKIASLLRAKQQQLIKDGYDPVWVMAEAVRIRPNADIIDEYNQLPRQFKPIAGRPGLRIDELAQELSDEGFLPPNSGANELIASLKRWQNRPQTPAISSLLEEAESVWRAEKADYLRVQPGLGKEVRDRLNPPQKKRYTETQALRRGLQREAIAAARASTAGKMELQKIKKTIADMLDQFLSKEQQGKYVKMLANATTPNDVSKAAIRISEDVEKSQRKFLINRIKRESQIAMASKAIAVDYRQRIASLMDTVLTSKPRMETIRKIVEMEWYINKQRDLGNDVEIPVYVLEQMRRLSVKPLSDMGIADLEDIYGQIKTLADLGRVKFRVRQELDEIRQQRDLAAIQATARAINKKPILRVYGKELTKEQQIANDVAALYNWQTETRLGLTPTDVVFDMLDGMQNMTGPVYRIFKARLDNDFGSYINQAELYKKRVRSLAKGLNQQNFERIGLYATAQQEDGMAKLANVGVTEKDIPKLNEQELAVYKEMRRLLDFLRPQVADVMKTAYNVDLGEVKNYFPFITDWSLLEDQELKDRTLEQMIGLRSNVEKSFTKSRVGPGKHKINLNAMEVFEKHVDDVAYLVNVGKTVKYLGEIARSDAYKEAVGEFGQKFTLEWLDTIARKGGVEGAKRIKGLDILRRNTGAGILAYKLSTAIVQLMAVNQGAALIGGYAYKGLWHLTDPQWRAFVLDNMPEVRARIGDDPAFRDSYIWTPVEKMRRGGFWALQKLDRIAAGAVAAGAYDKWHHDHGLEVDLNNPKKEAIEWAQRMVRRTQASPFFKDQPGVITRGKLTGNVSLDRLIFQFQNFMLNEWSLIRHEGFRTIAHGDVPKGVGALMGILLAALAEQIGREILKDVGNAVLGYEPKTEKEFGAKMFAELAGKVPFVSQIYSLYLYGNPIGVPALQSVSQFAAGTKAAATGKTPETRTKGVIKAAGAVGTAAGVPGAAPLSRVAEKMIKSPSKKKGEFSLGSF